MKKIMAIVALAATAVALNANPVIYVVDLAQVHKNYYKTKIVQDQLTSALQSTNAELKKLEDQRQKLVAEIQEGEKKLQNPVLAEPAKKEIVEKELNPKANEIRNIVATMQSMKAQAQQKLMEQQKEVISEHKKDIVKVVEKIAEAKKADFVVEKNACYFSKPTADITEDVIAELNASAPKN